MANINDKTIVYITRDLERALGPQNTIASFFIITNSTPFAKRLATEHKNILLVNSPEILSTHELLQHPETSAFLEDLADPQLLVFKNTGVIEKICSAKKWPLLNPSAELAAHIEEKISQVEWLGELTKYLPEHQIHLLKEVWFDGTPFILQFNRAHTGEGTVLINNDEILQNLKNKYPERPVRVTAFIKGTMLTSNNVVFPDTVLIGSPNVQITGLAPFTDLPFATIGNDWSLAPKLLTDLQRTEYNKMVEEIGARLRASGWRGLFGVDIMLADSGRLYLIEINARQPAGVAFESRLQQTHSSGLTSFGAHLLSLMGKNSNDTKLILVNNGAQIILRNQVEPKFSDATLTTFAARLEAAHFTVTRYLNTEPGSDLVRIQTDSGLLEAPQVLNLQGETIVSALNCSL